MAGGRGLRSSLFRLGGGGVFGLRFLDFGVFGLRFLDLGGLRSSCYRHPKLSCTLKHVRLKFYFENKVHDHGSFKS